jgi:hypothetical protein
MKQLHWTWIETPAHTAVSEVSPKWNPKEAYLVIHTMSGTISDTAYAWSLKKAAKAAMVMELGTMQDMPQANTLKIFDEKRPKCCLALISVAAARADVFAILGNKIDKNLKNICGDR